MTNEKLKTNHFFSGSAEFFGHLVVVAVCITGAFATAPGFSTLATLTTGGRSGTMVLTSPRSKECPTANTDAGATTDDNRDEVECWWWGGRWPDGLWSGTSNWVDEAVVVAVAAAAMAAANSPAEVSVLKKRDFHTQFLAS